jgi:hypothetical protein
MKNSEAVRAALLAALTAFVAAPLRAQDIPLAPPSSFEQGANLTYGGFLFFTRLQAGIQATDNVREDPSQKSDFKSLFLANAVARSTWKEHALAFTGAYARQSAVDTANQTSEAKSGSVSGRYDFSPRLHVNGGVLHTESIVGKNDPQQFSGNLNGTTAENTFEAAADWQGQSYFVRLEGRHDQVKNRTDIKVSILSRIQQQDRTETEGTLQVGRNFSWGKAYVLGGGQRIHYTGSAVILPEDRDSKGGRGGVGVEYQQGPWTGIFRLFAFDQSFDAPSIGRVVDVVGTGQLAYKVSDRLSLGLKLQRSFDEINIQGSGGLFTNLGSVGAQYQFADDFYVRIGPSYRYYQIEGTSLEARSVTFDAMAAWQVHPRVELTLNASHSNQWVNNALLANLQYNESTVTLSTVITF